MLRFLFYAGAWIVLFVCSLWAVGAIHFDFPIAGLRLPLAFAFALAIGAIIVFVRGQLRKLALILLLFVAMLSWWLTLKPSDTRNWQADVAQTAWAEINGDEVTVHNVRNCEYRTETDYTPRWETRTVRLSQVVGTDIAITYWGSPYIAHPIVSFQFKDAPPLCFSIETRKEVGEEYSAVAGFYRQYELIYVCADERDVIRLRANYRRGEDVYLYHTLLSPAQARTRFMEYLNSLNSLHLRPRWYNALTTNCTTAIRQQHAASDRKPFDWRIIANGKADEMLFERKAISTGGLVFPALKDRSHINERAHAANDDPDFSKRIREGLPPRDGDAKNSS